ncbi:hypothetical protein ACFFMN_28725 [Planobispora siamensis]|uniref:Secreted protein n=1 Tax=Planobispora siamensis TaxID=936338 RepID=A0A8J3SS85_9ACTN|nr:hypothetical protein [Planobispora siamensis]GIH97449.1 hypothetical protein Psi01_80790 [Planobispora siamensis]
MKIRRYAAAVATTAAAATLLVTASGAAHADTYRSKNLVPGEQYCVAQLADYQVRGDGTASRDGAKFKLRKSGTTWVIAGSPGLVNIFAAEGRSSLGTFLGQGSYELCATNNGVRDTFVTLRIRSDGEFR